MSTERRSKRTRSYCCLDYLRNQASIGLTCCQTRCHGNIPGMPPHQLHDANTTLVRARLNRGRIHHTNRLLHRSVEPKRLVDQGNIVVNSFGNARDGNFDASRPSTWTNPMSNRASFPSQ